jgi:hypothetical protein
MSRCTASVCGTYLATTMRIFFEATTGLNGLCSASPARLPRIGRLIMRPTASAARDIGASLFNDK